MNTLDRLNQEFQENFEGNLNQFTLKTLADVIDKMLEYDAHILHLHARILALETPYKEAVDNMPNKGK